MLSFLFFVLNYSFLDKTVTNFLTDYEFVYVDRIIDGDTIIGNNESIRLLGINSPERGEKYYSEAKEFLEKEILNKPVRLKFGKERYDRYKRILAYVFLNDRDINLELVEKGFANYYFPSGKDQYYSVFQDAWNECVNNEINLCEKSQNKCAKCIELKELNYENQEVVFYNKCNFSCDLTNWEIKDEGRKKFIFPEFVLYSKKEIKIKVNKEKIEGDILTWERKNYVWTKTGDTLFLRDSSGKLVLWEGY